MRLKRTLIKRKSLIVAAVSGFIIAAIPVLSLIGYGAYSEFKREEARYQYRAHLQDLFAKVYAKHLAISAATVTIETDGALRGKPVLTGTITNRGARTLSDLLARATISDTDGAVLYAIVFHPHEPPFGADIMARIGLSAVIGREQTTVLQPGDTLTFKRILAHCPAEITNELTKRTRQNGKGPCWPGTVSIEILAVDFAPALYRSPAETAS